MHFTQIQKAFKNKPVLQTRFGTVSKLGQLSRVYDTCCAQYGRETVNEILQSVYPSMFSTIELITQTKVS